MTEDHRSPLHSGLDELRNKIVRLAWAAGEVVSRSTNALLLSDLVEAQRIIDDDDDTDLLSVEIEELCFELLVLQSPLARDLRLVVASMKINSDLERAADLMVNVAKATRRLHGSGIPPKLRGQIRLMGDEAAKLLRFSIDAYAQQDAALGAAVRDIDDTLDRMHREFVAGIFEGHASTDVVSALLHHLQAGEAAPAAKPAKTESYERPEREERPQRAPYQQDRPQYQDRGSFQDRPQYQDRGGYQDRRQPERYDDRPRYDDAPPARPKFPVSERPVAPKRPASKPAVLIKPPGAPTPKAEPTPTPTPTPTPIPAKAPMPWKTAASESAAPVAAGEKPSRKTPTGQTKLFINAGSEAGIAPIDVVNCITGETGLPGKVVGKVDIRERHLFVDVAEEHANVIIAKLNRAEIKGQKVKIKAA